MSFLGEDFLLTSQESKEIYAAVRDLPILDYHCHLSPKEIYENVTFSSLGEAWLGGDHYKWRVMRAMGVPERLVTGDASYSEKLRAFASVMPMLAGNPLYHFSHLELKNHFGITTPLTPDTVEEIEKKANEVLKTVRARDFIINSRVEAVVTTDSPLDDLKYHRLLKEENFPVAVLPSFRPDLFLYIERDTFTPSLSDLAQLTHPVATYEDLLSALYMRLDYFRTLGCVSADHGLDYVPYVKEHKEIAKVAFQKRIQGASLTQQEIDAYKCDLLCMLAQKYRAYGMVNEVHFGCYRNGNSVQFRKLGADTGYDGIRGYTAAENLYPLLDEWEQTGGCPRTLLFSLNPQDNALLNTVAAAFQKEGERGWVQQGSAWWFNDHYDGMLEQMRAYSATLPIGTFAGMLTDSRSFLSYARHEYFRRILSDLLGRLVAEGKYPSERIDDLKKIAVAVAYKNTRDFFGFSQK